jgi:TonB family protein
VKQTALGCLLLCSAAACFGQGSEALCPRHMEAPDYPPIARSAHVTGKITLTVTIDAEGRVENVDATAEDPRQRAHPLLQRYAIENMRHWTFAKPPAAPYMETIVYDYELDADLPSEGGPSSLPAITKVNFDLPDHVTILTNVRMIETSSSGARH